MWWSEACLEMSVCLYSTGRDASMSVFHSMTVNPHYGGGLINLLLLKMPKHFSCECIKIALQFALFFCCCCCLLFALLPQSEDLTWHWDQLLLWNWWFAVLESSLHVKQPKDFHSSWGAVWRAAVSTCSCCHMRGLTRVNALLAPCFQHLACEKVLSQKVLGFCFFFFNAEVLQF